MEGPFPAVPSNQPRRGPMEGLSAVLPFQNNPGAAYGSSLCRTPLPNQPRHSLWKFSLPYSPSKSAPAQPMEVLFAFFLFQEKEGQDIREHTSSVYRAVSSTGRPAIISAWS